MKSLENIKEQLDSFFVEDSYFQAYSFTTENIGGYLPHFELEGKSLLTVGSSADQAINASLAGCEDITIYDICPLTKYFYNLKLASLLSLDREEFLKFLCGTYYKDHRDYNPHLFSKKTYQKVREALKGLDEESFTIWEEVFKNYHKDQIKKLFRRDINDLEDTIECNPYLQSDEAYNKTRKILSNVPINIQEGNIMIPKIDRKFDNIWLSNVAHCLYRNERLVLLENNEKLLNENGKLLLCYFWNTGMTIKGFPIDEYLDVIAKKIIISGTSKEKDDNSILVYQKRKIRLDS